MIVLGRQLVVLIIRDSSLWFKKTTETFRGGPMRESTELEETLDWVCLLGRDSEM